MPFCVQRIAAQEEDEGRLSKGRLSNETTAPESARSGSEPDSARSISQPESARSDSQPESARSASQPESARSSSLPASGAASGMASDGLTPSTLSAASTTAFSSRPSSLRGAGEAGVSDDGSLLSLDNLSDSDEDSSAWWDSGAGDEPYPGIPGAVVPPSAGPPGAAGAAGAPPEAAEEPSKRAKAEEAARLRGREREEEKRKTKEETDAVTRRYYDYMRRKMQDPSAAVLPPAAAGRTDEELEIEASSANRTEAQTRRADMLHEYCPDTLPSWYVDHAVLEEGLETGALRLRTVGRERNCILTGHGYPGWVRRFHVLMGMF